MLNCIQGRPISSVYYAYLYFGKTPHSQGEFVVSCFFSRGTLKMVTLLLYNGFFITNTSFYSVPNQAGNFSDLVEGS